MLILFKGAGGEVRPIFEGGIIVMDGEAGALSGAGKVNVVYFFELESLWNVRKTLSVEFTSLWNIGEGDLSWYRIEGECVSGIPDTCKSGVDTGDEKCGGPPPDGVRFLTIVAATSLSDLCNKLKGNFTTPPVLTPVKSIKKYSRPLLKADQTDVNACNELIDQEFCSVPECLEFCIEEKPVVEIGFTTVVVDTFFNYEMSGGIGVSGRADTNEGIHISSGGIVISGEALVLSSGYLYILSGGVVISGESEVAATYWAYAMSGGIDTSGEADIVSTSWHYDSSGGISLSGNGEYIWGKSYEPLLPFVVLNGKAIVTLLNKRFIEDATGGILMGGEAETLASVYLADSTGGILMGGEAGVISSSWSWLDGTGGIVFGGEAGIGIGVPAEGEIGINGTADVNLSLSIDMSGVIQIGGEAGVVSEAYFYFGSGGIVINGEADTTSSFKGTFEAEGGVEATVFNIETEVIESSVDVVEFTIDDGLAITSCGCTASSLVLTLSHELLNSKIFNSFIKRNGLDMPAVVDLHYRSKGQCWKVNFHFTGLSPNTTSMVSWSVFFEWACTDVIGEEELGGNLWKFCMFLHRKDLDTQEDSVTRVIITIPASTVCINNLIEAKIKLNTDEEIATVENGLVESVVYFDGIGVFKDRFFKDNPIFHIGLTELDIPDPVPRFNVAPLFPPVEEPLPSP